MISDPVGELLELGLVLRDHSHYAVFDVRFEPFRSAFDSFQKQLLLKQVLLQRLRFAKLFGLFLLRKSFLLLLKSKQNCFVENT